MIFNQSVYLLDETAICNVRSKHESVSDTGRNLILFLHFP
jgi:hypothetical protein